MAVDPVEELAELHRVVGVVRRDLAELATILGASRAVVKDRATVNRLAAIAGRHNLA